MDAKDLQDLKDSYPDALRVWYDRMFDLSKAKLIETLLVYMDRQQLRRTLEIIQQEIIEERNREE